MIELIYFNDDAARKAYQLIQFRAGEPWRVVDEGELLGSIEKLEGRWFARGRGVISDSLVERIGGLIDQQHFNRLPLEIKTHWPGKVLEVVVKDDAEYLIICQPGTDLERFLKLFSAYAPHLLKDEWPVLFKIYDSAMTEDYEIYIQRGRI